MAVTLLAIGTVASAGAGIAAAGASKKAAKNAAAAQQKNAAANMAMNMEYLNFLKGEAAAYSEKSEELLAESKGYAEEGYNRIAALIAGIPSVESFYDRGENLSRQDFDYRTGIARENLAFILGDTGDELREVQNNAAGLANLEENAFTNNFAKIARSNLLGLKAETIGAPTGLYSNLSAQNLYNFSNQALSNLLQINDFFSKEGTVDPISPYQITTDLYNANLGIVDRNIGNEQFRTNNLISINNAGLGVAQQEYANAGQIAGMGMQIGNDYYASLNNAQSAGFAADASYANSLASSVAQLTQGLTGVYGLSQQQNALSFQQNYQTQMLDLLKSQSSSNPFAPVATASRPSVLSTRTSYPASYTPNTALPSGYGGASNALFPVSNVGSASAYGPYASQYMLGPYNN